VNQLTKTEYVKSEQIIVVTIISSFR